MNIGKDGIFIDHFGNDLYQNVPLVKSLINLSKKRISTQKLINEIYFSFGKKVRKYFCFFLL